MKTQYVPYIKTPAGCIAVCVSDLLHQGGGLLHFVAVPKAWDEGGRIRADTCVLRRLELTLALGVPCVPPEKAAKAPDFCCLSLCAPFHPLIPAAHHEYLYYHVYLMLL